MDESPQESESCAAEQGMENATQKIRYGMLVHKHYFSLKDAEACHGFDIQFLAMQPRFETMKGLFERFVAIFLVETVE